MTDDPTSEATNSEADSLELETRIVEVGAMPDASIYEGLHTKGERLAALTRHYQALKAPVIEQLKEIDAVQVKDLSSNNTLLVTAPKAAWLQIADKGGALDQEGVRVRGNTLLTKDKKPNENA